MSPCRLSRPAIRRLAFCLAALAPLGARGYEPPVLHEETAVVIIETDDVAWSGVPDDSYLRLGTVSASEVGRRLVFGVACDGLACEGGSQWRPFSADFDGQGVSDLSALLPGDLANPWWGWGNLRVDGQGYKVFLGAQLLDGGKVIRFQDRLTGELDQAVRSTDYREFWLDWQQRLFLGKFDERDPNTGVSHKGLWVAALGGGPERYLDAETLPCSNMCDDPDLLNMMSFVGVAREGGESFFIWDAGDVHCQGEACNHKALWRADLGGGAARVTAEEHYWVDDGVGGWRGTSDRQGDQVLYGYIHREGDPQRLVLVDRQGNEALLSWNQDHPRGYGYTEAMITPSGRFVLARGPYGSAGGWHYNTLFDLQTGTYRDTWSNHLAVGTYSLSNLVEDRYYFLTVHGYWPDTPRIYRVDTQASEAGDFSQAPKVEWIDFDGSALWDDDSRLRIQVRVSDAQGQDDIQDVRVLALVEGMETTPWPMPEPPLVFGSESWTWLYDDGTHGDAVAGDGTYTFDAIATRKGDRAEDEVNSWYAHWPLPHAVGLRVLVRDRAGNATLVDTEMTVVACGDDPAILSGEITSAQSRCLADQTLRLQGGAVVKTGNRVLFKAREAVLGVDTRVERGAELTIAAP